MDKSTEQNGSAAAPVAARPRPKPVYVNHCEECVRIDADAWGRSWVEIDLAAFRRNVERVAAHLPAGGKLIISAKKDAYGHGLLAVVQAVRDMPQVGAIGIATLEEGVALRQAGIELPILSFSVFEGEMLAEAIRQKITLTVTNLREAREADVAAARLKMPALAHFKYDTGMGRIGRLEHEVAEELPLVRQLKHLKLEAVFSHLADAWGDPDSAAAQVERMEAFRRRSNSRSLLCHWGGSDALAIERLLGANTWLRSGIALYGDHPALAELEPVMSFKSRVVFRRRVPAGTAISYGGTFTTTRETELAMVGAGYGNGLLRALSGRGLVLLSETKCPILGRVCMDQVIVDVTDVAGEVKMGDEAVLFGRQGQTLLPAAEQAALAGTISYELFCLAGQINPRLYVNCSGAVAPSGGRPEK